MNLHFIHYKTKKNYKFIIFFNILYLIPINFHILLKKFINKCLSINNISVSKKKKNYFQAVIIILCFINSIFTGNYYSFSLDLRLW
jgi:hypothetical protein